MDRRERLIEVFEDTKKFIRENKALSAAAAASCEKTKLYEAEEYPERSGLTTTESATVRVTKSRTFEAAMRLAKEHPDKKIAVLNFASATRPGGGVTTGASAQEECLCRCSTLYQTLTQDWLWDKYYQKNREARDVSHTDACIYSPGVVICKTDEDFPKRLPEEEWVTVDVINCAAPNLREEPANWHNPETGEAMRMDPIDLFILHMQRARHILHIADAHQVDILVLGAFGCGAFANDPYTVATAMRGAVREFRRDFSLIEFAIYCRPHETKNYTVFQNVFAKMQLEESNK